MVNLRLLQLVLPLLIWSVTSVHLICLILHNRAHVLREQLSVLSEQVYQSPNLRQHQIFSCDVKVF